MFRASVSPAATFAAMVPVSMSKLLLLAPLTEVT